jgi:uncharacterized damage-inducible protein DinB
MELGGALGISILGSIGIAVGDMLLHVALHGAYHRGQIALLVRAGGSTPSPTDYIAFIRGAPAATRTPVGDAPRIPVP